MTESTSSTTAASVEEAAAGLGQAADEAATTVDKAADTMADKVVDQASDKEGPPAKRPLRSPEEIKAELEHARQSLLSNVDAIQEYVKPANVLGRASQRLRRIYVADDGTPEVKRIAITAAVVGIYVLYRIRRR